MLASTPLVLLGFFTSGRYHVDHQLHAICYLAQESDFQETEGKKFFLKASFETTMGLKTSYDGDKKVF